MKQETKTVDTLKTVTEQVNVWKTTDGREFPLSSEGMARSWQNTLDENEKMKKIIGYKDCEVDYMFQSGGTKEASFTFNWDINSGLSQDSLHSLCSIVPAKPLVNGKYLVIEYNHENFRGRDYQDGYFGLLSDYIKLVEVELETLKNL